MRFPLTLLLLAAAPALFSQGLSLNFSGLTALRQPAQPTDSIAPVFKPGFRAKGYGAVNYYAFSWDTDSNKRNAIDPERLNMYVFYDFTEKIEFKSEIEFEHGGTGASMAFDPIEEFGAFEQEVNKGGEVIAEQINVQFKWRPWMKLRVGKMRYYMGNASKCDEPWEYFTAYRSEAENTILPLGWYETGLELSGDIALNPAKKHSLLSYKLYVTSGLDNSGFSSFNWVRRGYQKRFETINADNLAYALRLDYIFGKDSEIGICLYAGNTTGNRPKHDLTAPAWLTFGDLHFNLEKRPWRGKAYLMYGNLQNAEAVSTANRNLSNDLGVKRTPVGSEALGTYAELAYDLLTPLMHKPLAQFYVFGRAEYYDSMLNTEGTITDNPRYARTVFTGGINYLPHPQIVFKAHYADRKLGSDQHERTFCTGIGFNF